MKILAIPKSLLDNGLRGWRSTYACFAGPAITHRRARLSQRRSYAKLHENRLKSELLCCPNV
jgi:hypothetical protein